MNKNTAKTLLANAAKAQGLKVQVRAGKTADDVRVLNASTGRVVAEGTIKLDKTGYVSADVRKTVNQINVKLGKSKMNSSRRRKMNASKDHLNPLPEYYDAMSIEEAADEFGIDLDDMYADSRELERANYGSIVGYLKVKPEYEEALGNDGYDYLTLISDGNNIIAGQDSGGQGRPVSFYEVSEEDIEESLEAYGYGEEDFDSSKRVNASKKRTSSRRKMNSSTKRRKMNAGCHSKRKMNASDDDYAGEDAEFVDDVESIVVDDAGNEIVVDEMLVVQNPETNEISLFVPTEGDDEVPADVEVIGEVSSADDTVLDSSRKRRK